MKKPNVADIVLKEENTYLNDLPHLQRAREIVASCCPGEEYSLWTCPRYSMPGTLAYFIDDWLRFGIGNGPLEAVAILTQIAAGTPPDGWRRVE